MNRCIVKNGKSMRFGYTTGTCAAGAAKAAALLLLGGPVIEQIAVSLPDGNSLVVPLCHGERANGFACAAVVKDSGDDPDATHGLYIYAKVVKTHAGICIKGGNGVGTVTKPGLPCPVGEAAINPVPKKMIATAVTEAAAQFGYTAGFSVTIFVPGGEALAKRTFNPRLGIVGGISILGTTGFVEPMSESALVQSVQLELNTRRHDKVLLLSPGNYGQSFMETSLGLRTDHAIKCSNFIGEALDYAGYLQIPKILLVGHCGKLVKLGAGVMNTHSRMADCRAEVYTTHAALCGADTPTLHALMHAATTDEMHRILLHAQLTTPVYASILDKILFHLRYRLPQAVEIGVIVFTNEYGILMKSDNTPQLLACLKGEEP